MPYIEDSVKIIVDQSINELVQILRLINFETFPIICYDDQDLELASKAFWIIDALDFDVKVLVQSRGLSRGFRPLASLNPKESPSHLDISKITNSSNYNPVEFNLDSPIVPNISKNFSIEVVKNFLDSQKVPIEANGLQLTGQCAEQIALLLRFIGNNVAVLLTQIKSRTKTLASKTNEVYFSIAASEYFDFDEEIRARKSLCPDAKASDPPPEPAPQPQDSPSKTESFEETKLNYLHYGNSIEMTTEKKTKSKENNKGEQNCSCLIL